MPRPLWILMANYLQPVYSHVSRCSRQRVQQLKNAKSHVFWILKKNVKNVRIVSQVTVFNTQLPKVSTAVSHQHQTSCSEMWTQENAT